MYIKDIRDYRGKYFVTSEGQVFSRKHGKRSIINGSIALKQDINSCGYHRVTLSQNGKTKRYFVHRIVAEHFLPEPPQIEDRLEVNHLDGDKSNNSSDNLQWSSGSENVVHALDTGLRLRGESHVNSKLTDDQVRDVCSFISWGCPKKQVLDFVPECTKYQYDDIRRRKTWKHISKAYIF